MSFICRACGRETPDEQGACGDVAEPAGWTTAELFDAVEQAHQREGMTCGQARRAAMRRRDAEDLGEVCDSCVYWMRRGQWMVGEWT